MGESGKGLVGTIVAGVVLTSAVYLVLAKSKGFTTLSSQGVAPTLRILGNTARGQ